MYSIFIVVLVAGIIYLLGFTINREQAPLLKAIDRIFKKYGSRLVALNSTTNALGESRTVVRTFEDLVRIAEEITKPISYIYHKNPQEIKEFCVFAEECCYIYDFSDIPKPDEEKPYDKTLERNISDNQIAT